MPSNEGTVEHEGGAVDILIAVYKIRLSAKSLFKEFEREGFQTDIDPTPPAK